MMKGSGIDSFQLNVAGVYFAENVGYKLNAMPLDTSRFDKQKNTYLQ